MARARPECNGGNTRCSSAADRIIVPFLHGTCPVESFPLYSPPPPFLPPFFLTPPFHYRGNFSRFPIRFPRYTSEIFYTHTYIYISIYRCLKRESGKTVRRDKRVLQDFSRDKVVRHGDHGQPGARNSKDPEHVACSLSRRDIKSYLRLRYVRWLASWPTMLDGETKRITPEGSEAPKPASFRFPFPYYPASRLLFTNSLSVFIEGPRPLPVISNLLQNAWHFFEGKTEKGKGRGSVVRRVKDRSRGIGIGLERGSLAWKRRD